MLVVHILDAVINANLCMHMHTLLIINYCQSQLISHVVTCVKTGAYWLLIQTSMNRLY